MKIRCVAVLTSASLLFLTACGGSESSIQSSTSSADSSPQVTLPPKGSRPAGEQRPCWANGWCAVGDIGPGGGVVFGNIANEQVGQFVEVSKQTLAPDKLCDSDSPRKAFFVWPDYDGFGNGVAATSDLYRVCNKGLVGKVGAYSQPSPIYDSHWVSDDADKLTLPPVANCCEDWVLPTLEEAKAIYGLRGVAIQRPSCGGVGNYNYVSGDCGDWKVEDGWYYTATPNLDKCEYWAINMADGQVKSVKPNEQLRGLMVRYFGYKKAKGYTPPRIGIPGRSVLESQTPAFLQRLYDSQFKGFGDGPKPTTTGGIIDALLAHPNAVKQVWCPAPATTTTVAPSTTTTTTVPPTTTTTVAPTTTVKKVAPPTTVKRVAPTTTVKKVVKKK
jgi:hypothetical protein